MNLIYKNLLLIVVFIGFLYSISLAQDMAVIDDSVVVAKNKSIEIFRP